MITQTSRKLTRVKRTRHETWTLERNANILSWVQGEWGGRLLGGGLECSSSAKDCGRMGARKQ